MKTENFTNEKKDEECEHWMNTPIMNEMKNEKKMKKKEQKTRANIKIITWQTTYNMLL